MEARQIRGAQIAEAGGIKRRGDHLWVVPSRSHTGKWLVDYTDGSPTCTCPDYEASSAFCKHIFAIEIHADRLAVSAPVEVEKPKKVKYTQDWPAYNAAQANERANFVHLLHALCEGVQTPEQVGGAARARPLLTPCLHAS